MDNDSPTILRDRRDRWRVEVRPDGLVVVHVPEPLDVADRAGSPHGSGTTP